MILISKKVECVALVALIILTLVGCGGPSGPTTTVDDNGIRASLPGSGWYSLGNTQDGSLVMETWVNPDESMMFRVASDQEEVLSSLNIQSSAVNRYIDFVGYPPTTSADSAMLAGQRALRLEAIQPGDDGYHMVEYVVVFGFQHVFVGAGAKKSYWSNGGSQAVESILNSLELTGKQ